MRELLFMEPVFKEAIWAEAVLKDVFGYDIPSSRTGECWYQRHKNGDCRGIRRNMERTELRYGGSIRTVGLGLRLFLWEFPLLVKIIDARET